MYELLDKIIGVILIQNCFPSKNVVVESLHFKIHVKYSSQFYSLKQLKTTLIKSVSRVYPTIHISQHYETFLKKLNRFNSI